jgi:hypothetical protein
VNGRASEIGNQNFKPIPIEIRVLVSMTLIDIGQIFLFS